MSGYSVAATAMSSTIPLNLPAGSHDFHLDPLCFFPVLEQDHQCVELLERSDRGAVREISHLVGEAEHPGVL